MRDSKEPIPLSGFSLWHYQRMLDVIAADLSKQRGTEITMTGRKKEPKEKDAS